ncbi:MAG: calcium-translocating P-type ATPase, PMCA-type [Treponema sp.]|uniref:calcium-translocating P-type ATPase, PMCA-type n=1 Tax=Treponema sp. TaxID=166 RepID=UPI00257BF45A|nr:calcium-translocating P-type ATPase, PMCA-type [Treponema sp.]MBQ5536790.1 calcium-translocating P-type ATPase, PMCA-type [Treponema sp.]
MEGLSQEQVLVSRKENGSNSLPDSEPATFWSEFKETFGDPMIRILLAIAALMIGMFVISRIFPNLGIEQTIFEPIGTILAVFIVAFISAKTGVSSDQKYRSLKERTEKEKCKVVRDGAVCVVDVDDVVVGDVVLLQSGNKIPADGTLVEGHLSVDNSALNGEAEECKKTANPDGIVPEKITGDTFVDASSLFRGAVVFDGEGYLKVQRVGIKTMMGKMALEMNEEDVPSPLKVKLSKLAKQISVFGYCSAALIIVLYIAIGIVKAGGFGGFAALGWQHALNTFIQAIDLAILIVVCAVPEGLPLMISLVLMQNTSKMLDHNVLVRKAQGIETAGSLNILFSDKTGTITKGHLEVVEVFDGIGASVGCRKELVDCIAKNTQSVIDSSGNVIGGNATDQALMKFVQKNTKEISADGVVRAQGFNSANKFSQAQLDDGRVIYKGAPEKLLAKCSKYLAADGSVKDFDIALINPKIDEMAAKAMRMLAFAYKEKSELVENEIQEGLVLVGIASIRDDVRPEARDAIAEVQKAGIQVVMITGDRLETAKAIAKDAGLIKSDDEIALSSADINAMSDDEVKKILPKIRVIARALPTDKSRMVRLTQELNLVCGMTGDGVNDSPALKKADVGFAMGSGTEAAKEAGDIVVLDDNFRSIKDAVWYGRTIYHNILKFVRFQISINVAAVLVTLLSPVFQSVTPLTVVMLLFVNLVCDSLGSLMFGTEPALEKYMTEKPRRRDESIIGKAMMSNIVVPSLWIAAVGFFLIKNPLSLGFVPSFSFGDDGAANVANALVLQTMFFVFFIWSALINGFNCRSDGFDVFNGLGENKNFLKVFLMIVAIQAAIVCIGIVPGLAVVGRLFNCTPISFAQWGLCIVLSLTVLPIGLLNKVFFRK